MNCPGAGFLDVYVKAKCKALEIDSRDQDFTVTSYSLDMISNVLSHLYLQPGVSLFHAALNRHLSISSLI